MEALEVVDVGEYAHGPADVAVVHNEAVVLLPGLPGRRLGHHRQDTRLAPSPNAVFAVSGLVRGRREGGTIGMRCEG